MKKVKRISAIVLAVIFLSSFFAIPVHAVDPMTATAIANGFAQAITAYGAANGVSLTFDGVDSQNSDQIGERVHELWEKFRADQQTADDYLEIGEALMPSLFYKAEKAAGTAAIGISIAQEYMPDIDAFWNWVLSGPAEMVKVDNAFQWNVDPQTGTIPPAYVLSLPSLNGYEVATLPYSYQRGSDETTEIQLRSGNSNYPTFIYRVNVNGSYQRVIISKGVPVAEQRTYYPDSPSASSSWSALSSSIDPGSDYYYTSQTLIGYQATSSNDLPTYESTINDVKPSVIFGIDTNTGVVDSPKLSVQPYVGDAVAKPVPIPDTTDPDYGPIDWTGDLDLPWIDTLFGDGTGILTNEQITDIIGAIVEAITLNPDKTLELEDTATPPAPDPNVPSEIIIPFLPVVVPSFNFSLSGIWHYVREWVSSLGSWFALVFTVWGILPYALVVPVYATAVIVIVLGVYKRFFM